MVEKEERYICEVCHRRYDSKEAAEECEKSKPKKVSISTKGGGASTDWQVGDLVVKGVFDIANRLSFLIFGRIVDTDVDKMFHLVKPIVEFPDEEQETLDSVNLEDVVLFKKDKMEKVRSWIEGKIKSEKNRGGLS